MINQRCQHNEGKHDAYISILNCVYIKSEVEIMNDLLIIHFL